MKPQMANACLTVFFSLALGSCSPPPSPIRPTPSPDPSGSPLTRVTGFVLDGADAPVAAANLTFYGASEQVKTVSDASGAFEVSFLPAWPGSQIAVEKAGFEPSWLFLHRNAGKEPVRNLRLHQIQRVSANDGYGADRNQS